MAMRRRGVAVLGLALAGAAAGGLLLFWPHLVVRGCLVRMQEGMVWEVKTKEPVVALTVDDGPDPAHTPALLEMLRLEGIRATFFVVGERVRQYPELVKAICAGGHELGNHTDTWRNTLRVGNAEFEPDLVRAEQTLAATGCATRFFRPAGIWIRPAQLEVVKRRGYRTVLGSAYAYDSIRPPAWYIAEVIGRGLRPGAIIVIHDSGGDRSRTLKALPGIVKRAREKRLRFVTLSELVESAPQ